jgi:hypothetical protein
MKGGTPCSNGYFVEELQLTPPARKTPLRVPGA